METIWISCFKISFQTFYVPLMCQIFYHLNFSSEKHYFKYKENIYLVCAKVTNVFFVLKTKNEKPNFY